VKAPIFLKYLFLIQLFVLIGAGALLAQESTLVRFIIKNAESQEQINQVSNSLNGLTGIEMSRTDFNTRNHVTIISGQHSYSESFFNETLSSFGLSVGCFHEEPYLHQPIIPLNARHCIREIEQVAADRNGPCCSAHASFGCLNSACQTFVCNQDGFCCAFQWDGICAGIALTNANGGGVCAGQTNCPGTSGGGSGPCCSAHTGLGCQNAACQTAVCALDPFCCNNQWDAFCAATAVNNANASGACAGISNCPSPVIAPCCTAHPNLGCENAACQTAVCNADPFCCTSSWDAFCVAEATSNANSGGACSGISNCPTGTGNPVTAGDCQDAVDVCSDINFSINPNGFGSTNEICMCCVVNPCTNPTSGNQGCLLAGELNSTWMIVNIEVGGVLEFTFGGLGTQSGFYDWAMWPYHDLTCNAIASNSVAPVRCNWNGVSTGGTGLANTLPPGGNATNYETPLNVQTGEQYLILFSNWSSVNTSVPLEFYGSAQVSCEPILVLPVELVYFNATEINADVAIRWHTASEMNNDNFLVKRSYDGINWELVGQINGAINSSTLNSYELIDINPGYGLIYYSLSQQDINGDFKELGVQSVFIGANSVLIHPNPSSNHWNIKSRTYQNLIYTLFDQAGRKVDFTLFNNSELSVISLNSPKAGIYFLRINTLNGDFVGVEKLVRF
jgi:hypothetical protein